MAEQKPSVIKKNNYFQREMYSSSVFNDNNNSIPLGSSKGKVENKNLRSSIDSNYKDHIVNYLI